MNRFTVRKEISLNILLQVASAIGILLFNRNLAVNLGPSQFAAWSNLRYFAEFMVAILSLSFPQLFIIDRNNKQAYQSIVRIACIWSSLIFFGVILTIIAEYNSNQYCISGAFLFYSLFIHNMWKSAPINNTRAYILISSGPGLFLLMTNALSLENVEQSAANFSFAYILFAIPALYSARGVLRFSNTSGSSLKSLFENTSRLLAFAIINASYPFLNWAFVNIFKENFGDDLSGAFALAIYITQSLMMFPVNVSAPILMKHSRCLFELRSFKLNRYIYTVILASVIVLIALNFSIDSWLPLIASDKFLKFQSIFQMFLIGVPLFVFDRMLLAIVQSDGVFLLSCLSIIKILTVGFFYFSRIDLSVGGLVVSYLLLYSFFLPYYIVWLKSEFFEANLNL